MPVFTIKFSESGESFACNSEQSVLEGMVKLGRRGIPSGCRGGGCGVCRVEVVAGSFEQKAMSRAHISPEDERQGQVLACRIFPGSDLELRVLGDMKRSVFKQSAAKGSKALT